MNSRERIIVGISGGVDSAVAALRLLESGFEIHGLHMTNWADDDGYCTAADDYAAARRVCQELGIPLHRVDFSAAYREKVFGDFLAAYAAGRTPNPDVLCNRYIKFGSFIEHARRLGARRIATGHYARLTTGDDVRLLRAADTAKDQTYFLHAAKPEALRNSLFPIGGLEKAQVRRIANDAGMPNHDRPDSTGICFIGERPFREFLARYLPSAPGPIVTPDGTELGQHEGLIFYTVGQRSGIGVGGRPDGTGEPWYVAAKDPGRGALVVVQGRDHPLLWAKALVTGAPRWLRGVPDSLRRGEAFYCQVRIRHRHVPAPSLVRLLPDGSLNVEFDAPQWAVAPGQCAVVYDGEECLGGGVIERAESGKRCLRQVGPAPSGHPL
jgi:tRNA-specific 2-thiouridylase